MVQDITNEKIYEKLLQVENLIKILAKEEELILQEEELMLEEEHNLDRKAKEELVLLRQIHGKNQVKIYEDIFEWRKSVWEHCEDKKTIELKSSFDFTCSRTGKSCRFVDCYRNKED